MTRRKKIFSVSGLGAAIWVSVIFPSTRFPPGLTVKMGFSVREVQQTPNPNALKFMLDRPISEGTMSFLNAGQAEDHPIASRLFAIPGVSSLLLLGDFVTVNKTADAPWPAIKKKVRQVLSEV